MCKKVTRMSKVKQLLLMHRNGVSNRQIARELGLDKETVNAYVRKVKSCNLSIHDLLTLDDPILEGQFMAGNAAYKEARFEDFKALLPYFEKELSRKHVTRKLVWETYLAEHPDGYRYTQFCFHLDQQLAARKPTAILEHNPGEKLYVDYTGDTLTYVNIETGEIRKAQVFISTLPFSNYTYIRAVPSQSTDDFIHALACSLSFFGGCPKILVPDNLKAAVIKSDKYEPELNTVMEDFANHYGFVVCPARAYKPRDKASVENSVKIVYQWIFARLRNRTFFSIEEINEAFTEEIMRYNQTRMQQKNYTREEKFLAEEKAALSPLPEKIFEKKYYSQLQVATNNYIYLKRDNHYYSVPYAYIGQKVTVIYTRSLVQIYCQREQIAVHQRVVGLGYTTQSEHLCSSHQHYKDRSPLYYIQTAERRSAALRELFQRIFEQNAVPETLFKSCDGLLSLQRKTDPVLFERACQVAIDNNFLSYNFVKKIIETKTCLINDTQNQKSLPKHNNIRGKQYFINF
jgi:transposase